MRTLIWKPLKQRSPDHVRLPDFSVLSVSGKPGWEEPVAEYKWRSVAERPRSLRAQRSFNMVFVSPLTTLVSLSTLFIMASAARVQAPSLKLPADAAQNGQAVKRMFLYSYDAYKSVLLRGVAVAEILTVIAGCTRGAMMM